ncbi:ADA20 protein, partial [Nothoprocta pentlandii]|nr:ADA20 protein [Nothoprocta pentlandii]
AGAPGSAAGAMAALLVLPVLLGLAGRPAAQDEAPGSLRVAAAEVTVPRRLSPRAGHDPLALSYRLEVEGRVRVLQLRPRRGLVSPSFTLVTYGEDGMRWDDQPFVPQDCFFQGEVQGSPGSLVALSTCWGGLQGVLWVEGRTYEIEPVPDDPAFRHVLYRMEEATDAAGPTCGLTKQELQHQKTLLPWLRAARVQEEEDTLKGWWTHIRYAKLVVIADHVRFLRSGANESEVFKLVMNVINVGDSLYDQLSVQLYLLGLEIWTKGNFINITNSVAKTLADFNKWRKTNLTQRIRHDSAHLFAYQSFGKSLGLAYLGGICDDHWSSAVESFTKRKLSAVIVTFAHELGHLLGMQHDDRSCKCRHKKCIMYESEADTDSFSDCSYRNYFDLLGTAGGCLRQPPAPGTFYTLQHKYCGNEIVEDGEQCDCGSELNCRRDPCCHPNCTLTQGSVCASGECCKNCQLLPAGTLCRSKTDVCDLPEYCNGSSPRCQPDVYVQDGAPCKDGSYCYRGKCSSHSKQCKNLFGRRAKAAPTACFRMLNTRGDRFGNCGIQDNIRYTKCKTENILCGRVQCENIHKLPYLRNHITIIQTPVGDKKCWGIDYHVGMPMGDMGAVDDGTPCGIDRLCINRTCTNVTVLNYDCNVTKCHNRGVCNNRKNCHCEYGWAPPFCELEGLGGSIDSGPPPARQVFLRAKIGVAVLGVVVLCILLATLIICYKRQIAASFRRLAARF